MIGVVCVPGYCFVVFCVFVVLLVLVFICLCLFVWVGPGFVLLFFLIFAVVFVFVDYLSRVFLVIVFVPGCWFFIFWSRWIRQGS